MSNESPLSGIRVVDLADEKGELAGRILADFAAEVVRVEPPSGARSRALPPFATGPDGKQADSLYFAYRNSNKLGLALDLEAEGDRERLRAQGREGGGGHGASRKKPLLHAAGAPASG